MADYLLHVRGGHTVLANEEYDKLVALGRRAQRLYWRGYITAAVCVTIGWMAMTAIALVGRA